MAQLLVLLAATILLRRCACSMNTDSERLPAPAAYGDSPASSAAPASVKLSPLQLRPFLLVAFIGEARSWNKTWKSQKAFLDQEASLAGFTWGSIACIDSADKGLSPGGLQGLRMGRVSRTMASSWWGKDDDPKSALYCERGSSGTNHWVEARSDEGRAYYFNEANNRSSWTRPLELMPDFMADTSHNQVRGDDSGAQFGCKAPFLAVEAACFLRRISACRTPVLERCEHRNCEAIFVIRPDLEIVRNGTKRGSLAKLLSELPLRYVYQNAGSSSSSSSPRAAAGKVRQQPEKFHARLRCVGEGSQPRTHAFPAGLCNGRHLERNHRNNSQGTAAECDLNLFKACPRGHFTLDDELAFIPAQLAGSYFREKFVAPPSYAIRRTGRFQNAPQPPGMAVCPATLSWPEGVLTTTLQADRVPIQELIGIQTRMIKAADEIHASVHAVELDF